MPRQRRSTLLPYTTLFRSAQPLTQPLAGMLIHRTVGFADWTEAEVVRPSVKPTVRWIDRKSTRLNSSHVASSYAVFCVKKKRGDRELTAENNPPICHRRKE